MTVIQLRVEELSNVQLDAMVAHVEGWTTRTRSERNGEAWNMVCWLYDEANGYGVKRFQPSTDWADGGPIIEREQVSLHPPTETSDWGAVGPASLTVTRMSGPTPLVAAMRAFLAARVGETVELPI